MKTLTNRTLNNRWTWIRKNKHFVRVLSESHRNCHLSWSHIRSDFLFSCFVCVLCLLCLACSECPCKSLRLSPQTLNLSNQSIFTFRVWRTDQSMIHSVRKIICGWVNALLLVVFVYHRNCACITHTFGTKRASTLLQSTVSHSPAVLSRSLILFHRVFPNILLLLVSWNVISHNTSPNTICPLHLLCVFCCCQCVVCAHFGNILRIQRGTYWITIIVVDLSVSLFVYGDYI